MFNIKKLAGHSIVLMFVGLFMMFFYFGLQNDHINILTPYMQSTYGWTDLAITNPVTAAAVVGIVLYLVMGAAFVRFDVRRLVVTHMSPNIC